MDMSIYFVVFESFYYMFITIRVASVDKMIHSRVRLERPA